MGLGWKTPLFSPWNRACPLWAVACCYRRESEAALGKEYVNFRVFSDYVSTLIGGNCPLRAKCLSKCFIYLCPGKLVWLESRPESAPNKKVGPVDEFNM